MTPENKDKVLTQRAAIPPSVIAAQSMIITVFVVILPSSEMTAQLLFYTLCFSIVSISSIASAILSSVSSSNYYQIQIESQKNKAFIQNSNRINYSLAALAISIIFIMLLFLFPKNQETKSSLNCSIIYSNENSANMHCTPS